MTINTEGRYLLIKTACSTSSGRANSKATTWHGLVGVERGIDECFQGFGANQCSDFINDINIL